MKRILENSKTNTQKMKQENDISISVPLAKTLNDWRWKRIGYLLRNCMAHDKPWMVGTSDSPTTTSGR
jgi:hypothetical protein